MKAFLNKPYPYYIPFDRSFKMIVIFTLGFPIYYLITQPFGINNWTCQYKTLIILGMSLPVFLALSFNFYILPRWFTNFFNEYHWTIGREIAWSLWNILAIVSFVHLYYKFQPLCDPGNPNFYSSMVYGVMIGIIPGIMCVQYNLLRSSNRKLKKVQKINRILEERQGMIDNEIVELKGDNETIKIGIRDLLFIKADDNYCKIYWNSNAKPQFKMIRVRLKDLESQLSNRGVKKCHRSYLVNLYQVKSVSCHPRGYSLNLEGYNEALPVSRELKNMIMNDLEHLSQPAYSL